MYIRFSIWLCLHEVLYTQLFITSSWKEKMLKNNPEYHFKGDRASAYASTFTQEVSSKETLQQTGEYDGYGYGEREWRGKTQVGEMNDAAFIFELIHFSAIHPLSQVRVRPLSSSKEVPMESCLLPLTPLFPLSSATPSGKAGAADWMAMMCCRKSPVKNSTSS